VAGKAAKGRAALGFAGYAGALLGGRMPPAALRASMARSADGSLRDRQQIRGKSGMVQAGRGPLFRLAGNRAKTPGALGNTGRPRLGVVPRSTRTPSSTSAQPQPRAAEVHEGQVIAHSLLVASGDGTKSLESMDEDLDENPQKARCSIPLPT
jgi:hypothetical protein